MAYFTFSQGYRAGGINPNKDLLPAISTANGSDKVFNCKAGLKTAPFRGRLSLDATLFNMDWHSTQAREFGPAPTVHSYVLNAADANLAGVKLTVAARPVRNLQLSTSVTLQQAQLTKRLPDNYGPGYPSSTPLPGASRWSVANTVSYDLPGKPNFALAHRYLSEAPVAFGNPNTRGGFNIF